jgi:hypothetical protein
MNNPVVSPIKLKYKQKDVNIVTANKYLVKYSGRQIYPATVDLSLAELFCRYRIFYCDT